MRPTFLLRSIALLVLCVSPSIGVCAGSLSQQAILVPDYPDSADGLKTFIQDVFGALRANDDARLSQYFSNLAIPDHQVWFAKVFGPDEGARLTATYSELLPQLPADARRSFEYAFSGGRTTVAVTVFDRPLAASVMGLARAVVEATREPISLYSVDGRSATEQYAAFIGHFFYAEGKFRYVNDRVLRALSTAPALRIRVGGAVQQAKVIHKVNPAYPRDARSSRIEGTVTLHVIIGTDGAIKTLDVVRGDPSLAQAAADAVNQWRFQQTLLNNEAVEVDTLIDITFRL